jgi:hypothetical protein
VHSEKKKGVNYTQLCERRRNIEADNCIACAEHTHITENAAFVRRAKGGKPLYGQITKVAGAVLFPRGACSQNITNTPPKPMRETRRARADLRFARAHVLSPCSSTRQKKISRSLDAMIHPLAICSLPPRHLQRPPDEIEVAWDALSNTYVCLFDGACRLALEARGALLTTHKVE